MDLSVREINEQDIPSIVSYWLDSDGDFLKSMGVDLDKIPSTENLEKMLSSQLQQDYPEKMSYATIWEVDGRAIGHCNVGDIEFGNEAKMHLHIWDALDRNLGCGLELAKLSLPYFFNNLELKEIICEPYALNPAPNKTVEKLGFEFVKEYETIPGSLNCMQPVKQWVLTRERFEKL